MIQTLLINYVLYVLKITDHHTTKKVVSLETFNIVNTIKILKKLIASIAKTKV